MGIFDALNTAVGGLQSQSFALQNISGNIANASTTGYKGIDTSFEDLIPDSASPSRQVAGGVTAYAQATITTQGTVSTTTVGTNMAINGDGFFNVQKSTGTVDNVPTFSGVTDYTRRGDFQVNANGNLVNGAGYFLMGVAVDPKTGNPLGNVPQVLQFQNNFIPAQTTTSINYAANLPSTPTTATSATSVAGTINALGGLNPHDFSVNPMPTTTPATPAGDNTITGTAANNQLATPAPITTSTKLKGTAPSDSLTTSFVSGDTITVDTKPIAFYDSSAVPPTSAGAVPGTTYLDLATTTVGNLLTTIDTITGNPVATASNVSGGAITLRSSIGASLTVTSSNAAAFAALGLGAAASATVPPLRVAGSSLGAATSLVSGTPANTITWYTGESGPGSARATATSRVDQSVIVQYGIRANEQAIRSQLQNLAVFAAVTTSPTNPNGALQVQALSQRVAQNLVPQTGQQTIQDIQADLATAQATMKDAGARQTQSQSMLQNLIDQAETVSTDRVASQILALQTSLQASYQTTSMLSQLTLTKYLPVG
jgi:flagellar hook protein FlgE